LTESSVMADVTASIATFHQLAALGVQVLLRVGLGKREARHMLRYHCGVQSPTMRRTVCLALMDYRNGKPPCQPTSPT
jgi:alpha-D-ribose 1-methylphosphonate 5-triphosphate synthase subunit PhnH